MKINKARLKNKIIGAIQENRLDRLCELINNLPKDDELLTIAITFGNLEISKYLFYKGYNIKPTYYILATCKYNKIDKVYNIIKELYPDFEIDKKHIIGRLIDPSKNSTNFNRIEYAQSLLDSGFLEYSEYNEVVEELLNSNKKSAGFKIVLREFNLNKLLKSDYK